MRTALAALVSAALCLGAGSASAQISGDAVKIGVLNDQSGLYADFGGTGSVIAAKMAVEDSGLLAKGWKIDVLAGDHQNKPDVGVNIARQWIDSDKVDAIADVARRARHPRQHALLAVAVETLRLLRSLQLALVLEAMQAAGLGLVELRATGGFAKSPFWRQLLADVLGTTVGFPASEQGSAMGAALLGHIALGHLPSVDDAAALVGGGGLVPVGRLGGRVRVGRLGGRVLLRHLEAAALRGRGDRAVARRVLGVHEDSRPARTRRIPSRIASSAASSCSRR